MVALAQSWPSLPSSLPSAKAARFPTETIRPSARTGPLAAVGAVIGDLQFERRIALAGFHAAVHGVAHDRVEQGRGVAAMHDTERVVDRPGRRAFEHDKSFLGRHRMQFQRFDDALVTGLAGEDREDLIEA